MRKERDFEIIAFEIDKELKEKAKKCAEKHIVDGIKHRLSLSTFCRIAINKYINEIEKKQ